MIGDDGSDGDDISVDGNDDADGDFKADDENSGANNVSDLSNSFYFGDKSFFVVDDSNDVSGSFPSKRRGKRRIAFANHRVPTSPIFMTTVSKAKLFKQMKKCSWKTVKLLIQSP